MLDPSSGFDIEKIPQDLPLIMAMVDCGVMDLVDIAERCLRNVPKHFTDTKPGDHYVGIHPIGDFAEQLASMPFFTLMPANRAAVNAAQVFLLFSSLSLLFKN